MEKLEDQLPPPPKTDFAVLSLDLIDDPEKPMRSDLTPESVQDLVMSIKQVGIIEPLVVKPKGGRFEVIAGHRRLVAAEIAGLVQVPCFIVDATKEQGELLKIHENLYRADVKPSDEAEHFKYLISYHKLSPVRLAKLINKSETYVSDRLGIFGYPPELKHALDSKEINFSVAKEFAKLDDLPKLREYLKYAVLNGITQSLARQWVQDFVRSKEPAPEAKPFTPTENPATGIIENLSTCVFCMKSINLREANVVYIHDDCLREANQRVDNPEIENKPAETIVEGQNSVN